MSKKSVQATREKLLKIAEEANSVFYEREVLVEMALIGMLAGLHNKPGRPGRRINMSLVGEPGVAKSAVLRFLLNGIGDAKFRVFQIHRQTKYEEIFGQPKLSALAEDRYEYQWEGKAPDSDVVLFDEMWNGSGALLQGLHLLTNEGKFTDGVNELDSNLIFACAASNCIPDDDLDAMYDRFPIRLHVRRIQDMQSFINMMDKSDVERVAPKATVSLKEIYEVQEHVNSIEIPSELHEKIYKIRQAGIASQLRITDRRIKNGLHLVKASAFLNGHDVPQDDDIEVFEHVLWCETKEINTARDVVLEIANPLAKQIMEHVDAAYEAHDKAISADEDEKTNALSEANKVMQKCLKNIETLIGSMKDAGKMVGKYEAMHQKLKMARSNLVLEGLGINLDE